MAGNLGVGNRGGRWLLFIWKVDLGTGDGYVLAVLVNEGLYGGKDLLGTL